MNGYTDKVPTMNEIRWNILSNGAATQWGREMRHYTLAIGEARFDYYIGMGIQHAPKIADILNCLLSDMQVCDMSFDDFCDNCDYATDSRKALDTYLSCQQNGVKLRKALGKYFDQVRSEVEALEI